MVTDCRAGTLKGFIAFRCSNNNRGFLRGVCFLDADDGLDWLFIALALLALADFAGAIDGGDSGFAQLRNSGSLNMLRRD
jgi:hypothetical protein